MKTRLQQLSQNFAQGFGFLVLALVLATADCRTNRVKAQDDDLVLQTKFCNKPYYIEHYGEPDWHWYWGLHGCWIYDEPGAPSTAAFQTAPRAPRPPFRFVVR